MHKYYHHRIFKKYNDEIWGLIIKKRNYNYVKKKILLNYKDYIKKKKAWLKVNYKFFKFFRYLFTSKFKYKYLINKRKFINFSYKYLYKSSFNHFKKSLIQYYLSSYTNSILSINKKKIDKNLLLNKSRQKKNKHILKKFYTNKVFIFGVLNLNKNCQEFRVNNFNYIPLKNNITNYFIKKKEIFKYTYIRHNYVSFSKVSKFLYVSKKRLNLQRKKEFFYSVHIAAPEKKKKKMISFWIEKYLL